MTKAITEVKYSGKYGEDHYISHIHGKPDTEVSIKNNPKQPYTKEQVEARTAQNDNLRHAQEIFKEIYYDETKRAPYEARFRDYCQENGWTYVTKKGKTQKRRFIDFLFSQLLRGL